MNLTGLSDIRLPKSLVENRVSFAGPDSELSIYDTYSTAFRVGLDADQLLYCGMVSGRKIMHDTHHPYTQVFLPHESFVMAPGEHVEIDFPDASLKSPTTCLTIEIAKEKVKSISERMSDIYTLESGPESWQYSKQILHTHHTTATQHLLQRLVSIFAENHPDRDVMVEFGISELIVRMLRHQSRDFLLHYCRSLPDASGITAALSYLEEHLSDPLDIGLLTRIACMSRSKFYNEFKKQLGCSPSELHQQLRLKVAARRLEKGESVTKVCYDLGFANPSHFSRRFHHYYGSAPRDYPKKAREFR